ncbi:MAG: FecR domain-containing protein [Oscillospiraceae bacterium]
MKKINAKWIIIPAAAVVLIAAAVVTAVMLLSHREEYRLVRVNSFEGNVSVNRAAEGTLNAFNGMKLVSEDEVSVEDKSFLELLADEDKHIIAEENTRFLLNSSGTAEKGMISIQLIYGRSLFTIDNKLGDNSFFEVRTPNATLSVRGTSFSVEYDMTTGETFTEVFEGSVWVDYGNRRDILEKGETLRITPEMSGGAVIDTDISGGANIIPETPGGSDNITEYPTERKTLSITHYFRNLPDYLNAGAERIEFEADFGVRSYESTFYPSADVYERGGLPRSVMDIDEQFIMSVMDELEWLINAEITTDFLTGYDPELNNYITNINRWYNDFPSRKITLTDDENMTFEVDFDMATLSWVIADSTEEYADSNSSRLPRGAVNSEGRQNCLVGVMITFSSGNGAAAEPVQLAPPDSGSVSSNNISTSAPSGSAVFTVNNAYYFRDASDYSSAYTTSLITMIWNGFPESGFSGWYSSYDTDRISSPLNDTVYEIYNSYLVPRRAELDSYLDENDEAALKAFRSKEQYPNEDVTDWFPNKMTIHGSDGDYTFNISRVTMDIMKGHSTPDNPDVNNYPSGCYEGDDGYYYISGVYFNFFGTPE